MQQETENLSDLLKTAAENDTLLEQALKRLQDEAEGQHVDFFRHGQFGSHNA